jgi:ABC-type multidrug transport system permease subunit
MGLQILRFLGYVGVLKDLPWFWKAISVAAGAVLAVTAFVFERVSQMPVLAQMVFFVALLVGGARIMGALGHLGRILQARHQLS